MRSVLGNGLVRFARYGIVGLLNNGVAYVAFLLMVAAGLHPVASSAVCYFLTVALSYSLNRKWTFKSNGRHCRDVPRFLLAYVTGFVFAITCITVCLIWLLPSIAQLVTIGLTAVVIYSMLFILRFGQE